MAAPMESSPGNLKEKRYDEELDIMSPNFKPMKALYSKDEVDLPTTSYTQFNNLAEYESYMKRKDRGNPGKSEATVSHSPEVSSVEPSSEYTKTTEKTAFQDKSMRMRRERMNRNVLNRMEKLDKGPLSLLKRCVQEKLLVKVWTRGAVDLRGMCKGYIVAFDKHFNLAMIDVDELFRCPLSRDVNIRKKAKAEKRYVKYMKKKLSDSTEAHVSETSNNAKATCSSTPECKTSTDHQEDLGPVDPTSATVTVSDNSTVFSNVLRTNTATASQETRTRSQDTSSSVTNIKQKDSLGNVPDVGCDLLDTEATDQKSSAISLLERHVNQLFIRGDNVVSVAILE